MNQDRFAFAQFCDDVRFEQGNKLSIMGIYSGELFVPQLPATLPKLCCVANLVIPVDQSPIELSARLFLNEEQIAVQSIGVDEMSHVVEGIRSRAPQDDPPARAAISFFFFLTPFNIPGPAMLRAKAYFGDDEVVAGKLRLKSGEQVVPSFTQTQ